MSTSTVDRKAVLEQAKATVRRLQERLKFAIRGRDDVIDLRVLDRLSGEIGRGTVLELVAMFRDDVERSAPGLQRAAEVVDRAEVSSLAHRLRSAARTLGAEHLADMLGALEEGEPEGTTLTAVVSAVTEEMRLVVSELSSLVTAEASS